MTKGIITVTANAVVARRVAEAAGRRGLTAVTVAQPAEVEAADEPLALVVDLEMPGALEAAGGYRTRWPRALLAGFVSLPDKARWKAAEEAGYDLVATRGTIAAQLMDRLASWEGPPARRRTRVLELADAAGRLGLVARVPETPVGPVAVYQIGNRLFAAGDVCPHAGATLSEGEVSGAVVTCPLHGSQFDVRNGARLRGPADAEIPTYPLVVERGAVFLEHD